MIERASWALLHEGKHPVYPAEASNIALQGMSRRKQSFVSMERLTGHLRERAILLDLLDLIPCGQPICPFAARSRTTDFFSETLVSFGRERCGEVVTQEDLHAHSLVSASRRTYPMDRSKLLDRRGRQPLYLCGVSTMLRKLGLLLLLLPLTLNGLWILCRDVPPEPQAADSAQSSSSVDQQKEECERLCARQSSFCLTSAGDKTSVTIVVFGVAIFPAAARVGSPAGVRQAVAEFRGVHSDPSIANPSPPPEV